MRRVNSDDPSNLIDKQKKLMNDIANAKKFCLASPDKTEAECEKAKNDAIVNAIKNVCGDSKDCINAIKDGIKNGAIPITGEVI